MNNLSNVSVYLPSRAVTLSQAVTAPCHTLPAPSSSGALPRVYCSLSEWPAAGVPKSGSAFYHCKSTGSELWDTKLSHISFFNPLVPQRLMINPGKNWETHGDPHWMTMRSPPWSQVPAGAGECPGGSILGDLGGPVSAATHPRVCYVSWHPYKAQPSQRETACLI